MIREELAEFEPEMPDAGEPHWVTNMDGGPGEVIWRGGDHVQAYVCPDEAECFNCYYRTRESDEYHIARDIDEPCTDPYD